MGLNNIRESQVAAAVEARVQRSKTAIMDAWWRRAALHALRERLVADARSARAQRVLRGSFAGWRGWSQTRRVRC